ncbi:hypothetical protein Daus18300_011203 [Diaporthe australafricana]|uniref:AAA+ ATPase domain-containing protein n=1 Tax=Diaporthe australafricana TaxID=127596 RepID=A0ABR3W7B0_9PEZI
MATSNREITGEAATGVETFLSATTNTPGALPGATLGNSGGETKSISEPDASEMRPSLARHPSDNGDDGHGMPSYGKYKAHDGEVSPNTDDRFRVLSKIRSLQDELEKVERGARQKQNLENFESAWDKALQQDGGDAVQKGWAEMQNKKAQSFVKDTTAFAFAKEWVHNRESNFIQEMVERDDFNRQLSQRRETWEAKNGISQAKVDNSQELHVPWPAGGPFLSMPALFDPLSDEARFNSTADAQGYDSRERELRSQLNDLIFEKHNEFLRWKTTRSPPPFKPPEFNLEDEWPRPLSNYVQWTVFRYGSPAKTFLEEKGNLFAVEVLDGEPDLNASETTYELLKRTRRNNESEMPSQIPKLVQGFVPERIRLNGPQFAQTFNMLFPGSDTHYLRSQPRMTLLQPYRFLIHRESDIRNRHATLQQKFAEFDNNNAGPTQTSEHRSSVPDDPGQEVHAIPDGDVQSSSTSKIKIEPEPSEQNRNAIQRDRAEELQEAPKAGPNGETELPFAHSRSTLEYLGCLIDFMDTTISKRREYVQGNECQKIHFRDLWYLFSPGDEIIRRDGRQVYRVIDVVNPAHNASSKNIFFDFDDDNTTTRYFQVNCVYVDFNGKRIGPVSATFTIKPFTGERSVESLEVYPLRLHRYQPVSANQGNRSRPATSQSQTRRQQLVNRGKTFFKAASMKLGNAFYNGPTADGDDVESQVVVDFETALLSGKNFDEASIPQIKSLLGDADDGSSTSSVGGDVWCFASCCLGQYIFDDRFVDGQRREDYITSLIPKTYSKLPSVAVHPRSLEETTGENSLTDEEFLLMSYRVFAFVLRTRKWAELDLTYMEGAAESSNEQRENKEVRQSAFDQLVLPEGHKTIVLSLISQHYRNRDAGRSSFEQSDIVRGKGKGLILLLHGAPGVGKTSTAEGIAELFKKPLFTITCGDLGSTAREVEEALDLNFNLANRWGCILLLDEADVFLASRTATDFERNGLVAGKFYQEQLQPIEFFLRVLEYYAGILFLTTNRVGVIDEAFRSRIHISLYYPPLGYDETRAVFKLNLKLIRDRFNNDKRHIKIDTDDVVEYALDYYRANEKARWNGRQIRNACQTALALAEFKAQGGSHLTVLEPNAEVRLAVDNFKTVSKAYLEFTKYLKQLYGIHEDARAKELGHRARENNRQAQVQPTQQSGFGSTILQPGLFHSNSQPYGNVPINPMQAFQNQPYQQASMMGPGQVAQVSGMQQQPNQQVSYYSNPVQISPAGSSMSYATSSQPSSAQMPPQNQGFMGMQFQPAQGDLNQQAQPWQGQPNPINTGSMPQMPSAQALQQQYQPQAQQNPGSAQLGSQMPASPPIQAQQQIPSQYPMQQQQQQQQQPGSTWHSNVNTQNLQSFGGQTPPGPPPQDQGR